MPDFGNSTVFSQTDASNGSGTQPSWSGSAAPSTIDDAGRALQGAMTRQWNWTGYTATSTGSSNAYVLTYSVAPAALYTGQIFRFITNFANTGAATVNINSLGATTVKAEIEGTLTDLSSDDWASGQYVEICYNGSVFVWTNRGKISSASPTFTGTPVAPSAAAYTNTTQIATTEHVYDTVTTVPENAQSGTTYTLVLADAGKMVNLTNASAITLTVPPNSSVAFATNTRVDLLQGGAGQVTVAPGSGVTINSYGSNLSLTGQYSGATLWKQATNTWFLIGDITT